MRLKGVLGADRFSDPGGAPLVDAAPRKQLGAYFSEPLLQELDALALKVEPGFNPEPRHLPSGRGAQRREILVNRQDVDYTRAPLLKRTPK
jgi:hypothetical protein